MNALRYLITIPVALISTSLIYLGLAFILEFIAGMTFWQLVLFFTFFGGVGWNLFIVISAFLMYITSYVSPNVYFAFISITAIAVINGISVIYNIWTSDLLSFFLKLISTGLMIQFTLSLIMGASTRLEID